MQIHAHTPFACGAFVHLHLRGIDFIFKQRLDFIISHLLQKKNVVDFFGGPFLMPFVTR